MPIISSDIKFYLTGGVSNNDPNSSLGAAISSTEIVSNQLNNLFDDVTGDESAEGMIDYRCIGVKNLHDTLTLKTTKVWILSNTTSPNDDIEIGFEKPSGGSVQSIINELTAPSGIAFSKPSTKAEGLLLSGYEDSAGNIGPGKWAAIWIKRVVQSGAAAKDDNSALLRVEGDSNE